MCTGFPLVVSVLPRASFPAFYQPRPYPHSMEAKKGVQDDFRISSYLNKYVNHLT